MPHDDWLTAEETCARLRLKPQTLYSYVSRGLIEARDDAGDSRRSRYRAADVGRLQSLKSRGRKSAAIAEEAIAWGEPVLSTKLTTIARGRLFYRGKDVEVLAAGARLEEVARWLWACGETRFPPVPTAIFPGAARQRMFAALADKAANDPGLAGRAAEALYLEAAAVVDALANAAAGTDDRGPIHERLGRAWHCDVEGAELIRVALVTLADHELNASTFAARVTASTGASLASCALAGLSALSGPLHGGMSERVRDFVGEARRVGARETIARRLAMLGESPPGFGHPLYPDGDPRGRLLLSACPPPESYAEVAEATLELTGRLPNVDFALTAAAERLSLPEDAPFQIFAVARSVGWIAHALEQSRNGRLIRPRARYVGPPIEGGAT